LHSCIVAQLQMKALVLVCLICAVLASDVSLSRRARFKRALRNGDCPPPVSKTADLKQVTKYGETTITTPCKDDDCYKKSLTAMQTYMKTNVLPKYKELIEKFVSVEKEKHGVKDVVAVIPDVKSLDSATRKVKSDYAGDVTRVIDFVRGSVVYKEEKDVKPGICRLRQYLDAASVKRVDEKDAFAKPLASGYSDYKINFQFDAKLASTIVELQVHLCSLLYAKESKEIKRNGHAIYEERRVLDKEKDKDKIKKLEDEEKALNDKYRSADEQKKCDMKQWTANHHMFFL